MRVLRRTCQSRTVSVFYITRKTTTVSVTAYDILDFDTVEAIDNLTESPEVFASKLETIIFSSIDERTVMAEHRDRVRMKFIVDVSIIQIINNFITRIEIVNQIVHNILEQSFIYKQLTNNTTDGT